MSQSKSSRGKKQDQQAERRAFPRRKPAESIVINGVPRPRFAKAAAAESVGAAAGGGNGEGGR